MKTKLFLLLAMAALIAPASVQAACPTPIYPVNQVYSPYSFHVQTRLYPVGNSGISGLVDLLQLPRGGTRIIVNAFGLVPGSAHVSLYYGNRTCALEPYSLQSVVGGIYSANAGYVGATMGFVPANLNMIYSVSVREAGTFALQACAMVH